MTSKTAKLVNRTSKQGFTLIEILLVVVIIGMLAGVLVPRIGGKLGDAQENLVPAKLSRIMTAIGEYEMEFYTTPASLDDLTKQKDGKGPFLTQKELLDPWKQKFQYSRPGSHNLGYDLWTTHEGTSYNNWE